MAAEAEALLREAIAVYERSDYLVDRWEEYLALAEFLGRQGRSAEAETWIAKTRDIHRALRPRLPAGEPR